MKRKYTSTRSKKALIWLFVLISSIVLYYFASDYSLTQEAALQYVEEIWLYKPLTPVATFDSITYRDETYYPTLTENADHLVFRLMWFQLPSGWQEGSGTSLDFSPSNTSKYEESSRAWGSLFYTTNITVNQSHSAFFFGKISDPNVANWELEGRIFYSNSFVKDPLPGGTLVDIPVTEQWIEHDGSRYFLFTIDTAAIYEQLGNQYHYNTLMHLYDTKGKLLESINLGSQWTAYREE